MTDPHDSADPQCCQDWPNGHALDCPEMEAAQRVDDERAMEKLLAVRDLQPDTDANRRVAAGLAAVTATPPLADDEWSRFAEGAGFCPDDGPDHPPFACPACPDTEEALRSALARVVQKLWWVGIPSMLRRDLIAADMSEDDLAALNAALGESYGHNEAWDSDHPFSVLMREDGER